MQVAQLVASEISMRLNLATKRLGDLVALWDFESIPPREDDRGKYDNFTQLQHYLDKQVFSPSRETLVLLVPLPKQTAHRIARSADILKIAERKLSGHSSGIAAKALTTTLAARLHEKLGALIGAAHNELAIAARQCIKAAELGAPLPTAEEVYEED
jgi:hypothetical protein